MFLKSKPNACWACCSQPGYWQWQQDGAEVCLEEKAWLGERWAQAHVSPDHMWPHVQLCPTAYFTVHLESLGKSRLLAAPCRWDTPQSSAQKVLKKLQITQCKEHAKLLNGFRRTTVHFDELRGIAWFDVPWFIETKEVIFKNNLAKFCSVQCDSNHTV